MSWFKRCHMDVGYLHSIGLLGGSGSYVRLCARGFHEEVASQSMGRARWKKCADSSTSSSQPTQTRSHAEYAKVYWVGRHKRWGYGAILGKLHGPALQLFVKHGWQSVETDADQAPVFCWPTRNAGDFPTSGLSEQDAVPLIRPFPRHFTQRLDDKLLMAQHLDDAGVGDIQPPTWSAADYLQRPLQEDESTIWFLKHRGGVKGQSVYPFKGALALCARLRGMKNVSDFVVQRGVPPDLTSDGRKYVLRVHALLHSRASVKSEGLPDVSAYCHNDMIVIEHGAKFEPFAASRPAHISSAGSASTWPAPYLLQDVDLRSQVRRLVALSIRAVRGHVPQGPYEPQGAELCQVFGYDVAVDCEKRAVLLEINSYPAIASGTMTHVDPAIYTALVRDVLRLVVLPRTDGVDPELGGFERLDLSE